MSVLVWDQTGERIYETGVDRGVVYPMVNGAYPAGYAWNGLSAVNESPSGAEATDIWADNQKYLSLMSREEFGCTIEAYTYPEEFAKCDGTAALATGVYAGQQTRKPFGFSYRTLIGNDEIDTDYGYKIHIVYGCKASPSGKDYATVNDSPEAINFSWEITTTPVNISAVNSDTGAPFKPLAHIEVDSTKVSKEALKAIEDTLYGTAEKEASLPLPDDLLKIISDAGGDNTNP